MGKKEKSFSPCPLQPFSRTCAANVTGPVHLWPILRRHNNDDSRLPPPKKTKSVVLLLLLLLLPARFPRILLPRRSQLRSNSLPRCLLCRARTKAKTHRVSIRTSGIIIITITIIVIIIMRTTALALHPVRMCTRLRRPPVLLQLCPPISCTDPIRVLKSERVEK